MKILLRNYNDILTDVKNMLSAKGLLTDKPHLADVLVTWQDVRGEEKELAEIFKYRLNKPVVVVQHGRGATRDYCEPNKFPLIADKILVWGESEKRRLLSAGIIEKRIEVVGCPLFSRLKPRSRDGKSINVVFAPIISSIEEPENFIAFQALRIWESKRAIDFMSSRFNDFKGKWRIWKEDVRPYKLPDGKIEDRMFKKELVCQIPRNYTYANGLVNVKLTGVHDMHQYLAPIIVTQQGEEGQIDTTVEMMQNTDLLVCLEEGTMQLLACAMDVPIVVFDIFKYNDYGGTKDYDRVEKIKTLSTYRTSSMEKLWNIMDHALKNPGELRKHRIKVCEDEAGSGMMQNGNDLNLNFANENIVKVIESFGTVGKPVTA